ncbi:MAG: class I SAM-dependent methyltransferase [Acetobacterales bacterium]
MHKFYVNDLWVDLCLVAKKESVDYIVENMGNAQVCLDRFDLLAFALEQAPDKGLVMEFGVEKGGSIRFIAERTEREVHGFDSFEGIPEDWVGTRERKGKFSMGGRLPKVPSNVNLHVGWFDKTIPGFLSQFQDRAAFIHIDCDIYASTRLVLTALRSRISPGTVIVFDEYYNYPGWKLHEFKAFSEFIDEAGMSYEYLGFSQEKGHVAVRIL